MSTLHSTYSQLVQQCDSFPDRDIYMRYQWGHAIGHKYSHSSGFPQQSLVDFYAANPLVVQETPPPPPPPQPASIVEPLQASSGVESPQPLSTSSRLVASQWSSTERPGSGLGDEDAEGGEELGEDDMVFRGCDVGLDSNDEFEDE